MRGASELPFVSGMVQLGLRGVGSAGAREYADARAFGGVLVPATEIHQDGMAAALARIPPAERYYVTFDMDGMDPPVASGIGHPAVGRLTYLTRPSICSGEWPRVARSLGSTWSNVCPPWMSAI